MIGNCRLGHYTVGFNLGPVNLLGPYPVGLSLPGPVSWRVWAKAHSTHNAPIFLAREIVSPQSGKYKT